MDRQEIDAMLDQGQRVGFVKQTSDPEYLGWIVLSKLNPNRRLLEVLGHDSDSVYVAEERRREREPYLLMVIELKREVHDAGGYETEEDYRRKDRYWFATLEDVERKLGEWGMSLSDGREARELDVP
ncbi:hypothetical protein [Sorangium sp. So ce406]|uniref:hypothetical protein n=1 Tax=Sorangium sp. So ce406 TaxID=3133311 RepID=UPI003F5C56DC